MTRTRMGSQSGWWLPSPDGCSCPMRSALTITRAAVRAAGRAEVNAVPGLIANTDASGELGRRVAERLARRGMRQRLLVQGGATGYELPRAEMTPITGYDDTGAMTAALAGVETLLLIPVKERPDRARVHAAAVDAAVQAGVRRIVYSSFLGAPAHSALPFGPA